MPTSTGQADSAKLLIRLLPTACVALHLHDPHTRVPGRSATLLYLLVPMPHCNADTLYMCARLVCKPTVPQALHAMFQR